MGLGLVSTDCQKGQFMLPGASAVFIILQLAQKWEACGLVLEDKAPGPRTVLDCNEGM